MEKSAYEIRNIVISQNYTKSRKLMSLAKFRGTSEIQPNIYNSLLTEILDGETEDAVLSRFEDEDSTHWIQHYANKVSADLLTLGKIQPETMLELGLLPINDFKEVVKIATTKANKLNSVTIEVERQLRLDTIPTEIA